MGSKFQISKLPGPSLMKRLRPDLEQKYSEDVYDYIYLANSGNPTGEIIFKSLSENLRWAKNPMSKRLAAKIN